MKLRFSFEYAAISLLILLTAIVALVIFLGEQRGVQVTTNLPKGGEIGPFQTIKLTFSEPVDFQLVAAVVSMDPILEGYLEWIDARTIQFVPTKPFEIGTVYKLTLSPDILSAKGRELKSEKSWEFHVRDPMVVYLLTGNNHTSLWTMDLNKSPAKQITSDNIKINSFDASLNGDFIIFASPNKQNGIDLWRVSRVGNDSSILLDCGRDRCTSPVISPNSKSIAYSREAAGPGPDLPFGSPRIWILDLQNGQNSPVYADQQILGYDSSWSPDSTKLASYDGYAKQIRLFDFTNSQQYIFPSNTGGPVTWSPDSKKLLYTDIKQKDDGLRTQVHLADISLNDSSTLLGENDGYDYSYYSLAWSPVNDSVVLGLRNSSENPAEVFWLFDPTVLDGIIIADQPDYTYNSPLWDPWGTALIFQQFKLRDKYKPEIGLWKPGFNEPLILAQGVMPHWLP